MCGNERELAEVVASAENGEDHFFTLFVWNDDFHFAGQDNVKAIRVVTGIDDEAILRIRPALNLLEQRFKSGGGNSPSYNPHTNTASVREWRSRGLWLPPLGVFRFRDQRILPPGRIAGRPSDRGGPLG